MNITTREAANALGVSLRTAQRWAANGKLAATKTESGRWVITLAADLSDYKPQAIDKARDLIETGGIVPSTRRPGLFTAVSSDGTVTYLVHTATCSCPAGQRGRQCYHVAAARMLTAARRAA